MKKIALVTGSSRGIGAATVKALSRAGYAVCINYNEHKVCAERILDELRQEGREAVMFGADVSDEQAVESMVDYAACQLGGNITLLVNNAGIAGQMQFQDITRSAWDRMINVNLGGCYNSIQAVLPSMLHEHAGSIVNVSSIWGNHGASCEVAYSVTKHAIIGLTRSLAAELAPTGIRVNCVAPGVIDTDMVQTLGRETLDMLAEQIPMGRLGKPEEIAEMIHHLAEAPYTTGQVLTMDGGFII